jgi:hypothetical protein
VKPVEIDMAALMRKAAPKEREEQNIYAQRMR